jgi:hypothetical protein
MVHRYTVAITKTNLFPFIAAFLGDSFNAEQMSERANSRQSLAYKDGGALRLLERLTMSCHENTTASVATAIPHQRKG